MTQSGAQVRGQGEMMRKKWAEYRRVLSTIYSACWDCPRPCPECREWACAKAFGRTPKTYLAEECAATYDAVMEMRRRGTSILIGSASDGVL